jgi:hypothetical protein
MGQIFKMAFGALALAFCGWMAVFYGSALFLADFHGDWRGVVFAAACAIGMAWLFVAGARGLISQAFRRNARS